MGLEYLLVVVGVANANVACFAGEEGAVLLGDEPEPLLCLDSSASERADDF